jgi:hypothetical protein
MGNPFHNRFLGKWLFAPRKNPDQPVVRMPAAMP